MQPSNTVVHAVVSSRLDYCNALLARLPQYMIDRLQVLQNSAARLITGTHRKEHITPVLYSLHWLPVRRCIDFKVLLLIFKCLNGKAPSYLSAMLHFKDTRNTRYTMENMLEVPKTKCSTFGDRAFSVYAPRLWNKLPLEIRNIDSVGSSKSAVKTHLFKKYFC